ncbi:MAG TPA: SUMF1/EgtB/PvdO family nonheme iron enzyme, partial [Elusimicrobiales bacterium]|nr:SUMF1/EgtB/PvdO family nonheme iron enzyme [Elusimicrobiales bacterium]
MDIERIKALASAWFLPAAAAAAAVAVVASAVHVSTCGQGPRPAPAGGRSGPAAEERVLIPGGTFLMGSAEGEGQSEERPRHAVTLSAYYMDRREVSVGRYRDFAESSGRVVPRQGPWSTDSHPVVNVDWYDAEA